MRKADVVSALTQRASEIGIPFSERRLRDWGDQRLIQPATRLPATETDWRYSSDVIDRGTFILAANKERILRASLLKLYLWIEGYELDLEDVLRALKSEFKRTLARVRRENPPTYDARFGAQPNAWQKQRFLEKNQRLDPDFRDLGIFYSPEFLGDIASEMYWGSAQSDEENCSAARIFSGIFGLDDETENSASADLDGVTEQDFLCARKFMREAIFSLVVGPTIFAGFPFEEIRDKMTSLGDKIAHSLLSPSWMPLALAFLSVSCSRARKSIDGSRRATRTT